MIHYLISIFVQSVKMTCDSEFRTTEDGFDAQSTSEGPCVVPEGRQGKWGDGNDGNPSFQKQKLKTQNDKRACLKSLIRSKTGSSSECLSGPLGIKLDYSRTSCCTTISSINDSGMIPTWNLEHPSDAVTWLMKSRRNQQIPLCCCSWFWQTYTTMSKGWGKRYLTLLLSVIELHVFFLEAVIGSLSSLSTSWVLVDFLVLRKQCKHCGSTLWKVEDSGHNRKFPTRKERLRSLLPLEDWYWTNI